MRLRPLTAVLLTAALVVSEPASATAVASLGKSIGGVLVSPRSDAPDDPRRGGLDAPSLLQQVSDERVPGHDRPIVPHVDPVPPGIDVDASTRTPALFRRAGMLSPRAAASGEPVQAEADGSVTPSGRPTTSGLAEHVDSYCGGDGRNGNRVQVLYVREQRTTSRFDTVLPLLRNEVANVDDVFAVSAAKTGGGRRVRWVHDADCVPVIDEVVVPNGTFDTALDGMTAALRAQGFDRAERKYLAFAEADEICGIANYYPDDRASDNYNDGKRPTYARVDTKCWSSEKSSSTAAHELIHMLGGVMDGAPSATANGHCDDESDLMCYRDALGVEMRDVCATSQEQLLDCRNDSYFSSAPAAGSWLAEHWNTARSSFLADVAALGSDTFVEPTSWSRPSVGGKLRARVVATLTAGDSARPLAGRTVHLVFRQRGTSTWRKVRTTTTGELGRAGFRHRTRLGGHYAVRYDGEDGLARSRSVNVFSKELPRLTGNARDGRRHVLRGQLRDGHDDVLRRRQVVLQRGTARGWAFVAKDLTNRRGVARAAVRRRDGASYRWLFRGTDVLHRVASPRLTV